MDLTINYIYENLHYTVTIPAGADLTSLMDENGYIGFRQLDTAYGGRQLQ